LNSKAFSHPKPFEEEAISLPKRLFCFANPDSWYSIKIDRPALLRTTQRFTCSTVAVLFPKLFRLRF